MLGILHLFYLMGPLTQGHLKIHVYVVMSLTSDIYSYHDHEKTPKYYLTPYSNREKLFILGQLLKEWTIPMTIVGIAVSTIFYIFWYWWTKYNENRFMIQAGLEMVTVSCMRNKPIADTIKHIHKKKTAEILVPRRIIATNLDPERVITPEVPYLSLRVPNK